MVKRIGMRRLAAFAAAAALVLGLVGCGGAQSTAQGNTEPVNLSVWTYYNGDQLESFNKLVDTFNNTVGKEKNITVESYSQGSKIFPVAKSTELLFLNDTDWKLFAAATGAQYSDLETVEGLVKTAEAYYNWTDAQTDTPNDGKALFGRDAICSSAQKSWARPSLMSRTAR